MHAYRLVLFVVALSITEGCAHGRGGKGPPRMLVAGSVDDAPAGTSQPVWFVYAPVEFARHRLGDGPVDACLAQQRDNPKVSTCWFVMDDCTTMELDLEQGLARLDVYRVGDRVAIAQHDSRCAVRDPQPMVGMTP